MKKLRFGLQARFLLAMGVALLVVLALLGLLLQRQSAMQGEVDVLGREAMQAMAVDALGRRGAAMVEQLADSLTNPLYYSDLDAIGITVRAASRQPDVAYVLVYGTDGNIVHDGSYDIAAYGQPMTDPLAHAAVASEHLLTQWSPQVMDVSEAISIGNQRIGGVRVGYSLTEIRASEERAAGNLNNRLLELGRRHMGWFVALLAALAVVSVGVAWYVQRTLVKPIRQLADAANAIGTGDYDAKHLVNARQDEVGDLVRAFSDMNDSIARHDRDVRRMAYTDALTGLTNRLAFRESLDHRLMMLRGAGRQLAVLFADIDDFKRVNDTLGHEAGDEVLLQVATRIDRAVHAIRGADAMVARFGGDEFVVLLQAADNEPEGDVRTMVTRLAETLVRELGEPMLLHGRQVFLGSSVGVALFPDDAASASLLMKNGDIAMYQAKVAGKNCHRFYSRAMDQALERRVRMEQDLRGAWGRGELSLVYQPIYRASDQALVGCEALLRWSHPEDGAVAPSVFIEVAEQSGLIEVIGRQALQHACTEAASWQSMSGLEHPLFVSVNVSARQLRSGDLVKQVADVLAQSGLPPERLHLELTETAVISDEANATAVLARLREMGVRVWLDDFGTGYSSLSHLRRVQVDGLKIDRSFIADLLRDPDDLALTSAILAMAHSMGVTVVAEGVERQGQLDLLRERDCDLVQGYLLGYPMDARDFRDLLG